MTLGDPNKQTGGYLYHRRLAEAAARHEAEMRFVSFPDLPFPFPRAFARRVMSDAADADVVVVDSIAAAFVARPRAVGRRLVGMLHQGPGGIDHGPVRTRLQAALDRAAYRHMRLVLVASESLRRELTPLHEDVRLVAPGRDVAPAPAPEVADLRRGRGAAVLCVANWVPRKGVVELLDAFAKLPEGTATLHLVGDERSDARYAIKVRRRARRLGDRVVAHGVVPKERVAALYRDSDLFAMASLREPYGTVYGEAMAAGLPVVGWNAGNLPHLARHGREALIVEPGDAEGLAEALRRLAEDEELRSAMAEAARARAETFPTWEQTATTFFSALRSVCRA